MKSPSLMNTRLNRPDLRIVSDPILIEIGRKTRVWRPRRIAVMLASALGVAAALWVVVAGFRGTHISRNAAALTAPGAAPAKGGWRPWWLQ